MQSDRHLSVGKQVGKYVHEVIGDPMGAAGHRLELNPVQVDVVRQAELDHVTYHTHTQNHIQKTLWPFMPLPRGQRRNKMTQSSYTLTARTSITDILVLHSIVTCLIINHKLLHSAVNVKLSLVFDKINIL